MAEIPVNTIEEKDGQPVYNLSSTYANDNWMAAARLQQEGKTDELADMQKTRMVKNTDLD